MKVPETDGYRPGVPLPPDRSINIRRTVIHGERTMMHRLAAVLLAGFAGPLAGGERPSDRIASPSDLGLQASDVPVSTETKITYLVNPLLNRSEELAAMLEAAPRRDAVPAGWSAVPFGSLEAQVLAAPGRPGNTAACDAVSDVADQFFRYMFAQVPASERSLQQIVLEVSREDFPLASVDAVPRLLVEAGGKGRALEVLLTLRFFMVHVASDRERNLRWVTRCEPFFEDAAVGRCLLAPDTPLAAALGAATLDALRGKIAVSVSQAPALRRPSGRIDEPRRELLDRSISTAFKVEAPGSAETPAGPKGDVPATAIDPDEAHPDTDGPSDEGKEDVR
jgi:hypothetical protein